VAVGIDFGSAEGNSCHVLDLLMLGAVPVVVVREPAMEKLDRRSCAEGRDNVREQAEMHRTGEQAPW